MWHLDTNIAIAYLNGNRSIAQHIKQRERALYVSSIVLAELHFGAHKSTQKDRNLRAIGEFLELTGIVAFDSACAATYGSLRAQLLLRGRMVPELDLLIAATAITLDATLVTDNTKDFEYIPGLKLENWLR